MFAKINGVKTYYEVRGKGTPIVMTLHGGPGIGDSGDNMKMFGALEDEFSFVYFDQRGNGQSGDVNPETYTHDQIVEDTETLRKFLNIPKMALSGGSYGGILALEYVLKYPEHVTHLILRGTAASHELQNYAFENALNSNLPGINREMLANLFFGRMKSNYDLIHHFSLIYPLYSRKYTPEKAKKLFERKTFHYQTHNAFFQHAFPNYDIRDRLSEIRVKTLILAGRHDWITPLRFAEELHEKIENSTLVIFEDAGHSINSDMPEKFRETVRKFLRDEL